MASKEKTQQCKNAVEYFKKNKDILIQDCAKMYGISAATLTRWLKKCECYEKRCNNKFKETERNFVEFYKKNKDTLTVKECAKKFNITSNSGYTYLKKAKIVPQQHLKWCADREIAKEAAQYYAKHELVSVKEVAKKFGLTSWYVTKALENAGIAIHDDKIAHINGRAYLARANVANRRNVYTCNHDFFEKIDTEEKAYWLGFIAADGSIVQDESVITIGLAIRDYDHIHRFKMAIQANNPIREYKARLNTLDKSYESCSISITSRKMADDLKDKNVLHHKSKNEIPPNIPSHLYRHFIRGFFDGDGWICKYERECGKNNFRWEIGFGSSRKMLSFIKEQAKVYADADFKEPYVFSSIYKTIACTTLDIFKFIHWIYDDMSVYLPRKYEHALEFCRLYSILQKSMDYEDGIKLENGLQPRPEPKAS